MAGLQTDGPPRNGLLERVAHPSPLDIRELSWDRELCELLSRGARLAARPAARAHVYGRTSAVGGNVPVAGIVGDQQAALYGQACHEQGSARTPTARGASCWRTRAARRRSPTKACSRPWPAGVGDRVDYALEAAIFVTGAVAAPASG